MHETNWVPAIVVIALGVVLALVFLLAGRRKALGAPRDVKLADLDQRVQTLLDQLREMQVEKMEFGEASAAERSRLEKAAAAAMRERDEYLKSKGAAPAAPAAAPAARAKAAPATSRGLTAAAWAGGVLVFVAIVAYVLTREQKDRGDGGMTGRTPPGAEAGAAQQEEDPALEEAIARAKQNPRDVEASAMAVHELVRAGRYEEAEELSNRALAADPFHVETRIHQAVIRATRGDFNQAIAELDRLSRYPEAHEALLFRGALALQMGQSEIALDSFERFVAEAPPQMHPPQLASALSMLRQKVSAPDASTGK